MINLRLQCLIAALFFGNCETGVEVTHARKKHKIFGISLAYS